MGRKGIESGGDGGGLGGNSRGGIWAEKEWRVVVIASYGQKRNREWW